MANSHGEVRFPFAPIEAVFRRRGIPIHDVMANATVWRYRQTGIPLYAADRWACRLGYHPANLWGEDWWTDDLHR